MSTRQYRPIAGCARCRSSRVHSRVSFFSTPLSRDLPPSVTNTLHLLPMLYRDSWYKVIKSPLSTASFRQRDRINPRPMLFRFYFIYNGEIERQLHATFGKSNIQFSPIFSIFRNLTNFQLTTFYISITQNLNDFNNYYKCLH